MELKRDIVLRMSPLLCVKCALEVGVESQDFLSLWNT